MAWKLSHMRVNPKCRIIPIPTWQTVDNLLIGRAEVFVARFMLDQQITLPQPIDIIAPTVKFFDICSKNGDLRCSMEIL